MNIKTISTQVDRMREIDEEYKQLINNIHSENIQNIFIKMFSLLSSYYEIKREIKTQFLDKPIVKIEDDAIKEIVTSIIYDKIVFDIEKQKDVFEKFLSSPLEFDKLTDEEINKLESEHFYSWFSGYEYVKNIFQIQSLILDITIPYKLAFLVDEVRKCYAFEQYNAANSLCRTILEISMRDVAIRTGEIIWTKKDQESKNFYKQYPPWSLRDKVTKNNKKLCNRIKKLYTKLSSLIHGYNTNIGLNIKETFSIIQEIYEYNQISMNDKNSSDLC